MTAGQRRWHGRTWLLLGPGTLAGLVAALAARPPALAPPPRDPTAHPAVDLGSERTGVRELALPDPQPE